MISQGFVTDYAEIFTGRPRKHTITVHQSRDSCTQWKGNWKVIALDVDGGAREILMVQSKKYWGWNKGKKNNGGENKYCWGAKEILFPFSIEQREHWWWCYGQIGGG